MKNKRVIALFLATTLLISPIQQVHAENVTLEAAVTRIQVWYR